MKNTLPSFYNYDGYDYDTFWKGREYDDYADGVAIKALSVFNADSYLLEIGAGTGRNTLRYPEYRKIYLVDYSITMLEKALERLGSSERFVYVLADTYILPFANESFNRISMVRVSHHLSDLRQAFKELGRVSSNGARLIVDFPNKTNLKSRIRYLLKKQSWNPDDRSPKANGELYYQYHPEMFFDELNTAGFQVLRKRSVSVLRGSAISRIPFFTPLLHGTERALQKLLSEKRLAPSIFLDCIKNAENLESLKESRSEPVFICPLCRASLEWIEGTGHRCRKCDRIYPYRNGIHDFRVELSSPKFTEFEKENPGYARWVRPDEIV